MEPSPVPRTPRSQIISRPAPAAADGDDDASAETVTTTPRDSVETWTTEKITPFAPAADQRIVVKDMGKSHWEIFRSMSIMLLSTHMATWDWMLYMAGHKEHGPDGAQNILVRTIDGVGGYTGMQFFKDNNHQYATRLRVAPEGQAARELA